MMRFCQLMGFPGYSAMQRLFRETYAQGWPDYATRISNLRHSGSGSPAALLAEFVDVGVKSLWSLAATVDPEALERAAAEIAAGQVVHAIPACAGRFRWPPTWPMPSRRWRSRWCCTSAPAASTGATRSAPATC